MLMENNEEKRSIAWRTVMAVSSIIIIIIAAFFVVRLFTANPLEGTWKSEDEEMVLTIGGSGSIEVTKNTDSGTVKAEAEYSIEKSTKSFAVHINEDSVGAQAQKAENGATEEQILSVLNSLEGTYEYNVERNVLTLTELEYGEQMTFEKQ